MRLAVFKDTWGVAELKGWVQGQQHVTLTSVVLSFLRYGQKLTVFGHLNVQFTTT